MRREINDLIDVYEARSNALLDEMAEAMWRDLRTVNRRAGAVVCLPIAIVLSLASACWLLG